MLLSATVARSKASSGWTPLHLACYFGHRDVVEELLKVSAHCYFIYHVQCMFVKPVKVTQWDTFAGRCWCKSAEQHGWHTSTQSSLHWAKGKALPKQSQLVHHNERSCLHWCPFLLAALVSVGITATDLLFPLLKFFEWWQATVSFFFSLNFGPLRKLFCCCCGMMPVPA